jgi:hypothetical protein
VPRPAEPASTARSVELRADPAGADRAATATARLASERPAPASQDLPLTVMLAGLALGLQVMTRHGELDDHVVTPSSVRAILRLVRQGRAALARALAPRPGFALLLARPG